VPLRNVILIQVDVFKVPDLSTKERVNEAGVIVMPLIGPVVGRRIDAGAGRTVIAAELAKDHLQNPQVNVLVLEYANMNITVGGAVKKPGVFPMKGQTTLLQAISLAEGITEVAKPEEVVVFRSLPGQAVSAYVVDLKKVQRGDLVDPVLAVNDKVMVPESGSAVFVKNMTGPCAGSFRSIRSIIEAACRACRVLEALRRPLPSFGSSIARPRRSSTVSAARRSGRGCRVWRPNSPAARRATRM
jgi:hypothetical protein